MDLPNLFSVDIAQAATKLCALIITDSSVQAGLLRVHPGSIELVARSSIVPYDTQKRLPISTDEAFQQLGKESEDINDVVFVLADTWLDETGDVSPTKRPIIELLRKELLLNPVGYVVQQEALCDQVLSKRPQLSAVLLIWDEQALSASWIDHGAVKITVTVGRSKEMTSDLTECLHQIHIADLARPLPNRIVCASFSMPDTVLTEIQQQLLALDWQAQNDLSELPSIELLSPSVCSKMVFEVAGRAMGEVLGQTAVTSEVTTAQQRAQDDLAASKALPVAEPASTTSLLPEDDFPIIPPSVTTDEVESMPKSDSLDRAVLPTSFGVPINEPYETAVMQPTSSLPPQSHAEDRVVAHHPSQGHPPELSSVKRVRQRRRLKIGALIFFTLVFLVSSIVITMIVVGSAVVRITPASQVVSKEVQLAVSSTIAESNAATNTLKAREVVVEVSDTGETKTTGVKLIGEQAKGEVTIFNKTDAAKTLEKGSVLVASNLQYTLDETVEVPAASVSAKPGGSGEDKTYGQSRVAVTAVEIGVESNVPKETQFVVEKYADNSFSAKAETDFSGGSSREIQVVGQTDIDVILAELKKSLTEQAKNSFDDQLLPEEQVVINPNVKIVASTFSPKLGEDAESLTASVTLQATGLAYSKADIKPLSQAILQSLVPSGYSIEDSEAQVLTAATASASGEVVVDANLSIKAIAVIDENLVKSSILGKTISDAEGILEANNSIEATEISLIPSIVQFVWPYLPADASRVVVEYSVTP